MFKKIVMFLAILSSMPVCAARVTNCTFETGDSVFFKGSQAVTLTLDTQSKILTVIAGPHNWTYKHIAFTELAGKKIHRFIRWSNDTLDAWAGGELTIVSDDSKVYFWAHTMNPILEHDSSILAKFSCKTGK